MNAQPQSQHMIALNRANRIRLARAKLKREVANSTRSVLDVLRDVPEETQTMAVMELLMAQPRWGRTRVRHILLTLALPENKQIGTMTERQRTALVEALAPTPRGLLSSDTLRRSQTGSVNHIEDVNGMAICCGCVLTRPADSGLRLCGHCLRRHRS